MRVTGGVLSVFKLDYVNLCANKKAAPGHRASPAVSVVLVNKSKTVFFTESHKKNKNKKKTLNQKQTLTRREQISKRQSGEQAVSVVCVLGQLLLCVNACVCCRCSNSSK